MITCRKCQTQFNNIIIVNGIKRNLQNRKYCLKCSPFGKHNTQPLDKKDKPIFERYCPMCEQVKPVDQFYIRRKNNCSSHCKKCSCNKTFLRQRAKKQQAVEYKGGKCVDCGYKKCLAALEFHHIDPTQKDFQISIKLGNFEKIKKELDKCILLCCRCHRERHADEELFEIAPVGIEPTTSA